MTRIGHLGEDYRRKISSATASDAGLIVHSVCHKYKKRPASKNLQYCNLRIVLPIEGDALPAEERLKFLCVGGLYAQGSDQMEHMWVMAISVRLI